MGFSRLGDLFALPPHAIGRRFGQDFLHYLQQITGERPDPRQPIELANEFSSELFYIDGLENTQALLFPAKRLIGEFCHYLRYRQLHCRSFNWHFEQLKKRHHQLTIHLSRPQNNPANFLELTRIRLESLALEGAVHSIALSSNNFSAAIAENQSLLNLGADTGHEQDPAPPELLLDKLSARLGQAKLFGIAPEDEHVPELAWRTTQLPAAGHGSLPAHRNTPPRPAWLLQHPAPLQQRARDLYWQGRQLTLLRGPERIDSHWWQAQAVRRDYFIARREGGGLYWIYREVIGRRWFVHGVFS
jgi:protein ImuB